MSDWIDVRADLLDAAGEGVSLLAGQTFTKASVHWSTEGVIHWRCVCLPGNPIC